MILFSIYIQYIECDLNHFNRKSIRWWLTRKLMKIKQAYESSVNSELIRSSWESTGCKITLSQGEVSSYSFSEVLHESPRWF